LLADEPVVRCAQCGREWKAAERDGDDAARESAHPSDGGLALAPLGVRNDPLASLRPVPMSAGDGLDFSAVADVFDEIHLDDLADPAPEAVPAAQTAAADMAPAAGADATAEAAEDAAGETAGDAVAFAPLATAAPEPEAADVPSAAPARAPVLGWRERVEDMVEPLLLALAWVGSIGVLAGAGWIAFLYRAQIVHAWPPSRRLFDLLGLA
jgi:hypothetical protein